jgi:hypothetical protein
MTAYSVFLIFAVVVSIIVGVDLIANIINDIRQKNG